MQAIGSEALSVKSERANIGIEPSGAICQSHPRAVCCSYADAAIAIPGEC
jgi:hypothetical protein